MMISTWERRAVVLLVLLVVVLVVWGLTAAPRTESARSSVDIGPLEPGGSRGQLLVGGQVHGHLAPGLARGIDLQIRNASDTPLEVRDVRVSLREVVVESDDPRGCGLDDFEVEQGDLRGLVVASGGEVRLSESRHPRSRWPRLRMIAGPWNQDGCQGSELVLGFDLVGVPA